MGFDEDEIIGEKELFYLSELLKGRILSMLLTKLGQNVYLYHMLDEFEIGSCQVKDFRCYV